MPVSGKRRRSENKRRQWAIIANEAEDIVKAIAEQVERERREKQAASLAETHAGVSVKKLTETKDENQTRTDTKLAETFPTNRTYINVAAKIIEAAPETLTLLHL